MRIASILIASTIATLAIMGKAQATRGPADCLIVSSYHGMVCVRMERQPPEEDTLDGEEFRDQRQDEYYFIVVPAGAIPLPPPRPRNRSRRGK